VARAKGGTASLSSRSDLTRDIYIARHGETEWNRAGRWQGITDIPLSDAGRAQARDLAERMRERGITGVHASDLARARETADIVAAALGLPAVGVDPRFRERGFGCFEGLTRDECAARHPEAWARYVADRRATPPEAEPQHAVISRIISAMNDVAIAAGGDGPVLVVSHGGAIRSFVSAVTGSAPPPLPNGAVFLARFDGARFVSVEPA
jgi:broad specificity phosphatase PhoE